MKNSGKAKKVETEPRRPWMLCWDLQLILKAVESPGSLLVSRHQSRALTPEQSCTQERLINPFILENK